MADGGQSSLHSTGVGLDGLRTLDRLVVRAVGSLYGDLRDAFRSELGSLVRSGRRRGPVLPAPRTTGLRGGRALLTGDLAWRLAAICLTATLTIVLRSTVVLALAQAAVIAALTIALSRRDRGGAVIPTDLCASGDAAPPGPAGREARGGALGPPTAGRDVVLLCRVAPATPLVLVVTVVPLGAAERSQADRPAPDPVRPS